MAKTRVKLNTKRMTPEQVDAANAKIRRIEDSTLPNLGRTLAAFRTRLLPGITTDYAVVLERA